MPLILIDKARPGMRIARPVMVGEGRVILAGEVLGEKSLSDLSRAGVWYLWVEEHPDLPVRERRRDTAKVEEGLEKRFLRVSDDRMMSRIKEFFRSQLAKPGRR